MPALTHKSSLSDESEVPAHFHLHRKEVETSPQALLWKMTVW